MKKVLLAVLCFWGLASYAQNTTFTKRIGGSSDDQSRRIIQSSNGDYYVLGNTESYGNGNTDIYITKFNGLGEIIWSYSFGTSGEDIGTALRQTTDGGIVISGYTNGYIGAQETGIVFKLNSSGTLQWSKGLPSDSSTRLNDVIESRTGDIYVTGTRYIDSLENEIIVAKFNSSGSMYWFKAYGGIGDDQGFGLVEDRRSRVLIVGSTTNDSVSYGGMDVKMIRIASNGNVLWSRNYGSSSDEQATAVRVNANYRYYVVGWYVGGLGDKNMFFVSLDTGGTLGFTHGFGTLGDDVAYDLDITSPTGVVTLVGSIESMNGSYYSALVQTNTTGNISGLGIYGGTDSANVRPMGVVRTTDDGFAIVANGTELQSGTDQDLYFFRTNNMGTGTCGTIIQQLDGVGPNWNAQNYDSSYSLNTVVTAGLTRTTISNSVDSTLCCHLEAKVAGDSIDMCEGEQVRLGATGISGYTYSWTAVGSSYTSSNANPLVSPASSTTYKLVVSSGNSACAPDSAYVHVKVSTRLQVDFVQDTFFCENGSVQVTAYPGLNSYTWTGNGYTLGTNPVNLNKQDTIELTVIDNNSCVYRDTFTVLQKALPRFNLGNDTSICENQDITLQGPVNMVQYVWNGNASSSRFFTTNLSQTHSLNVTDSFGCTWSDQMNLYTNPVSSFSLGADTSYCAGGFIDISGPAALTGYIWNDTATSLRDLRVSSPGTYHLTAFNSYNCAYSDTVVVTENPLPVFDLGAQKGFCEGAAVTIDGPAGLNAYSWTNGDSTQSTTVSTEGTASLTVTDANGCTYTDSVAVVELMNPTPMIGDGDTTFHCFQTSGNLVLNAGSYSSYQWSTGATSQTILVTDTGSTYTVTVTAANGCSGSASTYIANGCLKSIGYIQGVSVNVYPVPVSQVLNIESEVLLHNSGITMYDMHGRLVYESDIKEINHQIDVSGLAEGQYYIRLIQDNNVLIFKVIINH